jgi:hypothetical protein
MLLFLLVPLILIVAAIVWVAHPRAGQQAAPSPTAGIDPNLILHPQTVSQVVTAGDVRLKLVANPLIPGPNHLQLGLHEGSGPISGAHVTMSATMLGMIMRPVTATLKETQPGRYETTALISMLGHWRLTTRVDRPNKPSLRYVFPLSLDLPAGLLKALSQSTRTP